MIIIPAILGFAAIGCMITIAVWFAWEGRRNVQR